LFWLLGERSAPVQEGFFYSRNCGFISILLPCAERFLDLSTRWPCFFGKDAMSRAIARFQKVTPLKVQLSKALRTTMTPAEKLIWEQIRAKRLDGIKFRRQQVIVGFIADFYCDAAGLVVEIDGSVHNSPEQKTYDAERDRIFSEKGLTVLRIKNGEVFSDIGKVLEKIRRSCVVGLTSPPKGICDCQAPSPYGEGA